MPLAIRPLTKNAHADWDAYVCNHPDANLYQLSGWKTVIEKTYGHLTRYMMAVNPSSSIVGILPLVHMRHFMFGNKMVSIPFFDMGGLLADDDGIAKALMEKAAQLGKRLKADTVELRHDRPLPWLENLREGSRIQGFKDSRESNPHNSKLNIQNSTFRVQANTTKVRMLLELPDSSEKLMKSFKSKLRSQIKRPLKEGLSAKIGGLELLDDFYTVFCVNMRDLGSPVHSKKMIQTVLEVFSQAARVLVVYHDHRPVAGSVVVGFRNVLENPWASALRRYSRMSPNMLLYWTMLAHACDNGYRIFDFGRSTPGEGTYKFKTQWGALPYPLHWQIVFITAPAETSSETSEKSRFSSAIDYWKNLPVPISKLIGPMIRKHIAL